MSDPVKALRRQEGSQRGELVILVSILGIGTATGIPTAIRLMDRGIPWYGAVGGAFLAALLWLGAIFFGIWLIAVVGIGIHSLVRGPDPSDGGFSKLAAYEREQQHLKEGEK